MTDLKNREPTSTNTTLRDVAWKLEELFPEVPKRDGCTKAYLNKTKMTPEQYACDTLVVVKTDERDECFVCKQKPKTTKFCRLIQRGVVNDTPICTDCINAFIEYNPTSVFNLKPKETE